jgi:hypothetical protein
MKIKQIYGYYINPSDYATRTEKIEEVVNGLGLASVHRINPFIDTDPNKCNRMSRAHILAIETADVKNHYPYILFEDDCLPMRDFPKEIPIPVDADLIYLGGSNYWNPELPPLGLGLFDDDYLRVLYMLSAHAILIPDANGANIIWEAYTEAIKKGGFNDIELDLVSDKYNFLIPKNGSYFYQEGINEGITRFYY